MKMKGRGSMLETLRQVQNIIATHKDNTEIVICNKNGVVEYCTLQYYTNTSIVMNGKHILDIYPSLTEETSTIMRTLRTGKPITNEKQHLIAYDNQQVTLISTSLPIYEKGELIGVIDYSRFIGANNNIELEDKNRLYQLDDIITTNKEMMSIKEQIKRIADNSSTVLIYGETGTGKELVAQSIHTSSKRKDKPFISQNCAAIPANLFESIFFGTEKGSFTGAQTKKGLFELAEGGTLFLDEINSMDISMQVKLLKVLEDRQVRYVGGNRDISFDVRVICATNEKLEDLVSSKHFREDLYYRISIVKINIPPLRKRTEDIIVLANQFIQKYNKQMNKNVKGLSKIVKSIFDDWKWPGNVRELKNTIESAFNAEIGDEIVLKDVQEFMESIQYKNIFSYNEIDSNYQDVINLQDAVENYEKQLIQHMIENASSLTEAARKLSLTPQSLNYKIIKYHLR